MQPTVSPLLTFAREIFTATLFNEMMPLLKNHWAEIAADPDIELNPDLDGYLRIEATGMMRVYTLRHADRTLIGYCVFFAMPNLHYKQTIQALADVLFIEKEYRGGTGREFIAWCDEQLKADGVHFVHHRMKKKFSFAPMLESMGYEQIDLAYRKRLQ